MTTKEIIKKIPEIKLTPKNTKGREVVLRMFAHNTGWQRYSITEGIMYELNSTTSSNFVPNDSKIKRIEGIYYEYIAEINSVACALCSLDVRRPIENIPINWKVEDVFFITEKKECITKYGDKWHVITDKIGDNLPFSITGTKSIDNVDYDYNPKKINKNLEEAFSHLFPVIYINTSTAMKLDSAETLLKFLNYKEKIKKSGPKQKLIEELTAIELEEINDKELIGGDLERTRKTNYKPSYTYVKISPVKKGMCCLRYITKNDSNNSIIENIRIYVDKKSAIACKKNNSNEYVQLRLCSGKDNFKASKILGFKPEILEDTMLQYFGTIFSEIKDKYQSMAIWAFLQYPILEKLYKSGFKEIVTLCFQNWSSNPLYLIEKEFGKINSKAKSINKALGINKYQFDKYKAISKTHYNKYIIFRIKDILNNGGNIDMIDNNTFDKLFDSFVNFITEHDNYFERLLMDTGYCLKYLNELYSTKMMLNLCDEIFKIAGKLEADPYSTDYLRYYKDYLYTVKLLDDTKNYRPKFETLEDIINMHDAAMTVFNLKKEEYRLDAFKKHMKKWENFVYEGQKFSVIAPKHPGEIANEGITLHHCVKSYIDRIVSGETNIVFIRKNEELDKPFFTVQITNDKIVNQIHGFGNRNVNTEPELEEFVLEWVKNTNLKMSNINKVA